MLRRILETTIALDGSRGRGAGENLKSFKTPRRQRYGWKQVREVGKNPGDHLNDNALATSKVRDVGKNLEPWKPLERQRSG